MMKPIKYIKNEALEDEITPYMRDIIKKRYKDADKYLKVDVPKHTDIIPNIKVEVINQEIADKTISKLIDYFSENIINQFKNSKIYKLISNNLEFSNLITSALGIAFLNIHLLSYEEQIKKLSFLYSKNFKLPIGKDNNIDYPKFSNNKSSIATFLKVSAKAFPEINNIDVESIITDKFFVGLREPIINYNMNIRGIMEAKLYLYITDKPDDKLRMSVSLFYDSCQNIYTGGDFGTEHNKRLLSNVFDENSKVAYLIFDSEFTDKHGNDHPFTSIARTIIRVNRNGETMFDKVYPNDMEKILYSIIEDNTGLINKGKAGDVYHFKGVGLPPPYMDKYKLKNMGEQPQGGRMDALVNVMGFDPKYISEISENTFNYDGEEWMVLTYDEALDITNDYLRDNFSEFMSDADIKDIVNYNLIPTQTLIELFDIEDYLDKSGYDLIEYLNDIGFNTISDLTKTISRIRNPWRWYSDNLNAEELIEYFGGESEAMSFSLGTYDGVIEEYSGYLIFRTN